MYTCNKSQCLKRTELSKEARMKSGFSVNSQIVIGNRIILQFVLTLTLASLFVFLCEQGRVFVLWLDLWRSVPHRV